MNTIFNFGDPNLIAKGLVEMTVRDPATGNIVAYDSIPSEGAINYTFNLQAVEGGFLNKLVDLIPDTTRLSGSYTSQAFSLGLRQLQTGGSMGYNGITPVCETVTATGAALTVTQTPVKDYAQPATDAGCWCTLREHNVAKYMGANYYIDPTTKQVTGFNAISGKQYDVFYFTQSASTQYLGLPTSANPAVLALTLKYGIFAKVNGETSNSPLAGYLYVNVPRVKFGGDAGISGNQTSNSTTALTWQALAPDDNTMACAACGNDDSNYAYYVYVPCSGTTSSVEALAIIGEGVTVAKNATAQIPVKYLMPDGSTVQPVYSDLTYVSKTPATATVDTNGLVKGVAAGTTEITVTLTRSTGGNLVAYCNVTVTA